MPLFMLSFDVSFDKMRKSTIIHDETVLLSTKNLR